MGSVSNDAFGLVRRANDADERIGRIGEQQGGEVVLKSAACADAAAVELTFVIASGAVEVVEDAGAWSASGSTDG